jgi:DNA repair protein RadC
MKQNLNDTRAQYQLMMDEAGILLAAEDILRRRLERQGTIGSPTECIDYLRARCAHLANEVFGVLWLDTRHRVIDAEHLFTGTIDGCEIHPRIVAKRALETNAAAVVLFHNHPSGNPEPSEADRRITARLKQVLALLDVRVLDHVVLGALRDQLREAGALIAQGLNPQAWRASAGSQELRCWLVSYP